MKYEDLTYKINGCAMEVQKHLGNGFQEVVYQRAQAMNYVEAFQLEIGLEDYHD